MFLLDVARPHLVFIIISISHTILGLLLGQHSVTATAAIVEDEAYAAVAPPTLAPIGGVEITDPISTQEYTDGDLVNMRCRNPIPGALEWVFDTPFGETIIEDRPPYVISSATQASGETISFLTIDGVTSQDGGTYTCRSVADPTDMDTIVIIVGPAQGILQCRILKIIRDWPQIRADGYYERTNSSCDHRYQDNYYETVETPKRYFYRTNLGKWVLYGTACASEHWGMTSESTDMPWMTNFDNSAGEAITSISCVDFEEQLIHPSSMATGSWVLPAFNQNQRHMVYSLNVTLPDTVQSVTFNIEAGGGDCTPGNFIQLTYNLGEAPIMCFNNTSRVVHASYAAVMARKWFKLQAEYYIHLEGDAWEDPFLNLVYHIIRHDEDMEIISGITTPGDDTTKYKEYPQAENTADMTSHPEVTSQRATIEVTKPTDESSSRGDTVTNSETFNSSFEQSTDVSYYIPVDGQTSDPGEDLIHSTKKEYPMYDDTETPPSTEGTPDRGTPDTTIHDVTVPDAALPGPIVPDHTAPETTTSDPEYSAVLEPSYWSPLLIILIVAIILVVIVAIIATVICIRTKRIKIEPIARIVPDDERVLVSKTKREFRPMSRQSSDSNSRKSRPFSRSSNSSFRASPKSTHRPTITIPTGNGIDPDRFSLSGCITPLCEAPDDPFSTFTSSPVEPAGEKRVNDPLPEQHDKPVQIRPEPAERHGSVTESAVYEIQIEPGRLDLDDICHVDGVRDDSHLTTRL